MDCRRVNRLLALWVGQDLEDTADAAALKAHLADCDGCSSKHRRLQTSLDALQSVSTSSLAARGGDRGSLWPRLALVLKEMPRRRDHFNGWIPAAAMAMAALLMVAVSLVQIHREVGDAMQSTWIATPANSGARNLFDSDPQFAPGAMEPVSARPTYYVQPAVGTRHNF